MDFVAEVERNGYLNANQSEHQLKDLISSNFPRLRTHSSRGTFQECSELGDFRRVTLCLPRWPSFGQDLTYWRGDRRLARVMDGLKRNFELHQAGSGLPIQTIGKAIGSRIGGRTEGVEKVLRSAWLQYDSRARRKHPFMQIVPVLAAYSQCAEESRCQFHPSVVKARCLLWTFSQVIALEGKLLLSCSEALSPWSTPKGTKHREVTTFDKVFESLFILNIVIWRVTFDVVGDVASLLSDTNPPPDVLGAIFRILKDSRSLCLEFCLEGNLENCDLDLAPSCLFNRTAFTSDTALENWRASYRRCLESVLRSEGHSLQTDGNRQLLSTFYRSL
jgi:hypothetical protein